MLPMFLLKDVNQNVFLGKIDNFTFLTLRNTFCFTSFKRNTDNILFLKISYNEIVTMDTIHIKLSTDKR